MLSAVTHDTDKGAPFFNCFELKKQMARVRKTFLCNVIFQSQLQLRLVNITIWVISLRFHVSCPIRLAADVSHCCSVKRKSIKRVFLSWTFIKHSRYGLLEVKDWELTPKLSIYFEYNCELTATFSSTMATAFVKLCSLSTFAQFDLRHKHCHLVHKSTGVISEILWHISYVVLYWGVRANEI